MDDLMGQIKYVQLESGGFLADPDFQLMNSSERGIYCSIIFYMYLNDGKILNDPERIKKLCNADESFEKSWEVVEKKFTIKNGHLTHKRVRKELAKAKKFLQHQRNAGLASAKARQPRFNHGSTTDITQRQPSKVKGSKVKESKVKESEGEKIAYAPAVFLLKDEYRELAGEFGRDETDRYIEKLDLHIKSKGTKYESHAATIQKWMREDVVIKVIPPEDITKQQREKLKESFRTEYEVFLNDPETTDEQIKALPIYQSPIFQELIKEVRA